MQILQPQMRCFLLIVCMAASIYAIAMALATTMEAAVPALQTQTGPGTPAVIVTPVVLALRPSSLLAAVPGKHHADHHGGGDRYLQHHVIHICTGDCSCGGYACTKYICPGYSAPRSVNGCCYRNCQQDTVTDVGENSAIHSTPVNDAIQFACDMRGKACKLCDEYDDIKPYVSITSWFA